MRNQMIAEYEAWLDGEGAEHGEFPGDALELLYELPPGHRHQEWLTSFCRRWKEMEAQNMTDNLALAEMALEKWRRNLEVMDPDDLSMGTDECPFCIVYYDGDCQGCPIAKHTGQPYCAGTPYEGVHDAFIYWKPGCESDRARVMERVEVEISFLTMIRDNLKAEKEKAA